MSNKEEWEVDQRRIKEFLKDALNPKEAGMYIIFVPTHSIARHLMWPQVESHVAKYTPKKYQITNSELSVKHTLLSKDDCTLFVMGMENSLRVIGLKPTKFLAIGKFSLLAEKALESLGADNGLYKELRPVKKWWEFWK